MKKFDNLTKNKKESAIKVGSSVPRDAANIAFYSNESLSPKNNLSVVDVSQAINENKSSMTAGIKTFYANELGILEDENGNTMFPTANVTVSDSFIDKPYYTELLDQSQINPVEFFHHYYVSRFFTAAPGGISFSDLGDYLSENRMKFLNIKVLNEQNEDYIEASTGKKKYKILLEPFQTSQNQQESDIPYRIIVGLDSTKPVNLKLIYDKVECDVNGIITKQDLRYSETINASQYFAFRSEESYVTDNSYNKKVYSVKKYNKKYADIFPGNINTAGYNVFVPKKALADNRTYEVFNWRLIARSKQSVNLELVDYFADIEENTGIKFRTIKAAVLYDSTDTTSYDNIEPYVFYRLQNSPFNFSKFLFENPNAQIQEKNKASYWIVDVNSIESLEDYDVIAFCPTKALSEKAKIIISNYVKIQNGTIIVDGSNYPSNAPFVLSDIYINESSITAIPTYYGYNETNKILDENKNGGWNINQSIFENQNYGIFGLKKNIYRNLNLEISSAKSFLNIGTSANSAGSVGALFEFSSQGDALCQGNIIFTSFAFLEYCNSLYSIGGISTVANSNTGEYAVEESDQEFISSVTEGPFKFFYNCVSFAMYSRAYAGRSIDTRSSIFFFVGEWNSSWVMDSEALLDIEKEAYFTNLAIQNSNSVYARDLIKNYSSIKDYYLQSIYNHLPSYQRDKISFLDFSEIEFFLEITNPDIDVHNSTKITDPNLALSNHNIPTSYNLFKLNSGLEKAYAYTQIISPKINIPDGFGPYVVKEIPSIKSSSTRSILNKIDPINYFESYPFKFSTAYSYQSATDKPLVFSGDYTTNIEILFQGTGEFAQEKKAGTVVRNWTISEPPGKPLNVRGTATQGGVELEWDEPTDDGGAPITDYVIEYSTNSGSSWTVFADGTSTATQASLRDLSVGVPHVFRVKATNSEGTGSPSDVSSAVTPLAFPRNVRVPGRPRNVRGTATQGGVELDWDEPTDDGGAPITDYVIEYSINAGSTWAVFADGTSAATQASLGNLSVGVAHVFRVKATNSEGTGSPSDVSSAVTPLAIPPNVRVPGRPLNVRGLANPGIVELEWDRPTDNGGAPITDYVIEYSINAGSTWAVFADGTSAATQASLRNLSVGVAHVFRVKATNSAGTGSPSDVSSAITPPPTSAVINPGVVRSYQCVGIASITDLFSPQGTIPANNSYQWRAFDYTYDIDIGHGPDTYAMGATGPYVRYVQSAMKAGNFYDASVDGSFGPVTLQAVADFQSEMKAHKKVYHTSGRIDSPTKSLIAYAMKNNLFGMGSVLDRSSPNWTQIAQAAVTQIGTQSQSSASLINETGKYKKISYTGVGENPSKDLGSEVNTVEDYIFFSIPDGGDMVETVKINFGSDPSWRKVLLVSYGYSIVNHSRLLGDIGQVETSYLPKFNVNLRPNSNGEIELKINNNISNGAKHFYIHIRTEGRIGGSFGKAEGYAIKSIGCEVRHLPGSTI